MRPWNASYRSRLSPRASWKHWPSKSDVTCHPGSMRSQSHPGPPRTTSPSVTRSPPNMPSRPTKQSQPNTLSRPHRPAILTQGDLRQKIVDDFQALRIPLRPDQLDSVLTRAETEGMSHLEFLRALLSEQADQRRERSIAYRLRNACFAESKTLADFDWLFNARAIDRLQIEALARADFIGRKQNLVIVGQSGV